MIMLSAVGATPCLSHDEPQHFVFWVNRFSDRLPYYNGSGHRQDHLFVMSHNVTHGSDRYDEVNSKSANDGDDVLRD
jgi:hypothetical protein